MHIVTAAETYQKLMEESLGNIKNTTSKKKTHFRSSFTSSKKVPAQHKQSASARSWGSTFDEFSGVFAQHQDQVMPTTRSCDQDDSFGDFQSSMGQSESSFAPFASQSAPQTISQATNTLSTANTSITQPGAAADISNLLQGVNFPAPNLQQNLTPSYQQAAVSAVAIRQASPSGETGSAGQAQQLSGQELGQKTGTIATSSYPSPLSSTNVVFGVQGQVPNAPQGQSNSNTPGPPPSQTSQIPQSANNQQFGGPPTQQHQQQQQHQMWQSHLQQTVSPPDTTAITGQGSSEVVPSPSTKPSSPGPGVDPSRFHPIYHKAYRRCKEPNEEFVSTKLLYPVLLSSKLSRAQLRDLWSRANKGVRGKLTQMELFVLLGLVALAQVSSQLVALFVGFYSL